VSILNQVNYSLCVARPLRIMPSSWLEHVPFGMVLIDILRPRVVVELGTYNGVSYCAFCQAAKTLGLNSRCYAIDTWQGDHQAGEYGPDVLTNLRDHQDPLYGSFSELIQSTFDEALTKFENGSIDLLHIDGLHTYEAVRRDFENWLPKMSRRGVMLFHDINVRDKDFGVWKLWHELRSSYPNFEFLHGYGLGLLAVGDEFPEPLHKWLGASPQEQEAARALFEQLGSRLEEYLQDQQVASEVFARKERQIRELQDFVKQIQANLFFRTYHWIKYLGRK
jgi:hypothetical protein